MSNDLKHEIEVFMAMPFPKGFDDEAVDDVWQEFAEYDGYIAGLIISYSHGKTEAKEKITYDSSYEDKLKKRIIEKPELEEELKGFLEYLTQIKKLVEVVHSE